MARPASRAVIEDQIRKDLEQLYERYGQDAVEVVMQTAPKRRGRVKSGRGAPAIDRELRDAIVFALVEVVKLAKGDDNTSWACLWLANNVTIRGKEMRGGSMWQRSWKKPGTLRRIYNEAHKRWREDLTFQANLFFTYKMLIDWRRHCPGALGGFGIGGVPTHIDVFPTHPDYLIQGIDKLQKFMEQAQSKK